MVTNNIKITKWRMALCIKILFYAHRRNLDARRNLFDTYVKLTERTLKTKPKLQVLKSDVL